jgi:hypothetical protein
LVVVPENKIRKSFQSYAPFFCADNTGIYRKSVAQTRKNTQAAYKIVAKWHQRCAPFKNNGNGNQ